MAESAAGPRRRKTSAGPPATPTRRGRPQWLTDRNSGRRRQRALQDRKNDRDAPADTDRGGPERGARVRQAMADSEDKKPEKKEGGEGSLNIRIRDQTGEGTSSRSRRRPKLDKVFNALDAQGRPPRRRCASSSTARACAATRRPPTSTWRTATSSTARHHLEQQGASE